MWALVLQRITLRFFFDIFYFPIWWYTKGLLHGFSFFRSAVREGNSNLVPWLWLRNIFVPMYGQYDWQGRIMSFLVRSANVLVRSIGLAIWVLVMFLILLIWIALPLLFVLGIVLSLTA